MSNFEQMLTMALEAKSHSHSPYSNFPVGACIETKQGRLYAGTNVENAAYPDGFCAECSAIGAMVTAGESEIACIIVVSESTTGVPPCGGCRQKLSEFSTQSTQVLVCSATGKVLLETSMGELVPYRFTSESLEK